MPLSTVMDEQDKNKYKKASHSLNVPSKVKKLEKLNVILTEYL